MVTLAVDIICVDLYKCVTAYPLPVALLHSAAAGACVRQRQHFFPLVKTM